MRTCGTSGSHISSPEISTCPAEFVDEEACYARTVNRVSIIRCWRFSWRREF